MNFGLHESDLKMTQFLRKGENSIKLIYFWICESCYNFVEISFKITKSKLLQNND